MSAGWTGMQRAASWLRSVIGRRRLEAEMEDEVRFHLEARAADLERSGMEQRQARRQARMEFGAMSTHIDGMRSALGLRLWDELWADLHYATRLLRKSPGFTAIALGSLALAIGANTTIFSLANELVYARLGVPQPEQLRLFTNVTDQHSIGRSTWGSNFALPNGRMASESFTYPTYRQFQRANHVLDEIFAFKANLQANATVEGEAQAVTVELVSGNLYQQTRVRPLLGRPILPIDDGEPGTGAVATISYGFWQRAFGGQLDAVGKIVSVNTTPVTIVGVNPANFTGVQSAQRSPDLFMPLSMIPLLKGELGHSGPLLSSSTLWWVQMMARTKPGVSTEQAQVALDTVLDAAVRSAMPVAKGETVPHLVLDDGSRGINFSGRDFAKPMHVLLTFVGLVLLLASVNIANLMLARTSVRQREMNVRLALGASRSRIFRQVLTEGLLLSTIGGMFGLVLAYMGRTVLPKLMQNAWERSEVNVPFDWRVFAFTAGITLFTGVLFGFAPAWAATRAEIGAGLKAGGKTATRHSKHWSSRVIIIFQVALSTLLVVGACLFIRTLLHLNAIDPGFRTDHLVLFDINPPNKQYPAPRDVALHVKLEEEFRTLPGVDAVTLSDLPLLADSQSNSGFYVEGVPEVRRERERGSGNLSMMANVSRDFFSVLKIPIIGGRTFTREDVLSPRRVAIINQSLAKEYFGNQSPMGKRFSMDGADAKDRTWFTVVGVAADIRFAHLKDEAASMHYDLYEQAKEAGGVTYIVHTALSAAVLTPSLRAAVQRIDRNLPLMNIRTQQQQIDATMQQERMFASLTTGFGLLALALACVGIYGVMAYTVSQRTNEIGIRLALGARRDQVRSLVLREAGWLAVIGVVAGLTAALMLGRLVKSLLYGMEPNDPVSMLGSASLLMAVALAAGWVPARRAARLQPMVALRHE